MREKCIEILGKSIVISFDMEGYKRFSGEVYMAYKLGLITEEERHEWLAKAAEGMREN